MIIRRYQKVFETLVYIIKYIFNDGLFFHYLFYTFCMKKLFLREPRLYIFAIYPKAFHNVILHGPFSLAWVFKLWAVITLDVDGIIQKSLGRAYAILLNRILRAFQSDRFCIHYHIWPCLRYFIDNVYFKIFRTIGVNCEWYEVVSQTSS